MERNKQTKIMVIVALCVAVLCLTLGFAAFSNTLTIQSSATVTPDESDFKMVIYGLAEEEMDDFISYCDEDMCTSNNASFPKVHNATASTAVIDNDNLTIKNLNLNAVDYTSEATYYFKIVNEGKYDAYLSKEEFAKIADVNTNKQCIANEGTTQSYVERACSNLEFSAQAETSDGKYFDSLYLHVSEPYLKIAPNDFVLFNIYFMFTRAEALSDGDFSVKFDDIKLNFSTVEPSV